MSGEMERFDPAESRGRIAYEHFHRYALSRDLVAGRRVLDLACGTGYGSNFLAEEAREVVGIDISADAIETARSRHSRQNLKYLTANCYDLPFDDGVFDVVVCNELIEHVDNHDRLLEEARRVLSKNGIFLVTTPNRPIYNRYKAPNKFHISEMDGKEFQKCLDKYYKFVRFIGLRMALVSASYQLGEVRSESNQSSAHIYFGGRNEDQLVSVVNSDISLDDPEYFLAICSNEKLDYEIANSSIFVSQSDDIWLEHEKIMAWASGLHNEDEALRAHVAAMNVELGQRDQSVKELEQKNSSLGERLDELKTANSTIAEMAAEQARAQAERSLTAEKLARDQFSGAARILSRLVGDRVAQDQSDVIDSLFVLNERFLKQSARVERLEEAAARLVTLEQSIFDLNGTIASRNEHVAQLQAELSARDRLLSDAIAKVHVEQARLGEVRERLTQEQLARLKGEHVLEAARTEIESKSALIERQLRELERLASEHALLEDRNAEALAKVAQLEEQLADLEHLAGEHASLERHHAENLARVSQLEKQLADLEHLASEHALLERHHADSLAKISQLEGRLAELDLLTSEHSLLEKRHTEALEQIRQLDLALAASRQALANTERMQAELDASMSALRQAEQARVEEIALLKADLAMREEAVREGRDELDGLHREKSASEADNEALKAQVAELRNHINAVEAELAKNVASLRERAAEVVRLAAEDERRKKLEFQQSPGNVPGSSMAASANGGSIGSGAAGTGNTAAARPPVSASSANKRRQFATMHGKIRTSLQEARTSLPGHVDDLSSSRPAGLRQRFRKQIGLPPQETFIFDRHWITKQTGDQTRISLGRFLRDPRFSGIDPHPLFAVGHYLSQVSTGELGSLHPLQHYLERGWREGVDPHPYFSNDWYLIKNPDVRMAGQNPLEHYLQYGWREGRWPNPAFDPRAYLDRHPDVDRAGADPLTHFVAHGRQEGREVPIRSFNREWEEFIPASARGIGLMDYLIHNDPLPAVDAADVATADTPVAPIAAQGEGATWPPKPLDDYWLPQTLRDFIIDGYGEDVVSLYWHLCSVMARYEVSQDAFPDSPECQWILARLRQLSGQAAARQGSIDATIIIPVYNNIVDTLLCLVSILEAESVHGYEIIVADDGSSDATMQLIPTIGGVVKYLRQPQNFGFLGNCNAAAHHGRGRYIVLLNNDTLVLPTWLDALLSPFEAFGQVGLVGSKLVNWDGTLQEAGGIFWKDASAWNFGRGHEAKASEFSYVKDVDYCSGASIALPKALWDQLSGFDPDYSPAYCEDADIAFRVRAAGYRTIYQPHSEVVHHEGRSHGRDVTTGIKAYQLVNQRKFRERWRDVLEREHFPNGENVLRARDRSRDRPHVLVIDHYVPQFDRDAGSRTMFQYVRALQDMGFVVTFWPDNLWQDPDYVPAFQKLGVEMIYGPRYRDGFADFMRSRADLYDAVFLSRPHVAEAYLPSIRANAPKARILYYGHDLHFRRMESNLKLNGIGDPGDIEFMRSREMAVCNQCDVIFYPAKEEVEFVAGQVDIGRKVVANPVFIFDEEQIAQGERQIARISTNQSTELLFVGGFNHHPNREGVIWFVNQVMPILRQQIPGLTLQVVGSNAPAEVLALEARDIAVLGFVSDERLEELYAMAGLAVAPLRFGAGVKGKVVEAMAKGTPVVVTTVGAQGLDVGKAGLFVGDTAEEFASAVALGLRDRTEAARRATAALDFIRRHYTQAALKDMFRQAIFGD